MEAQIVLAVSLVGSLVGVWLVVDAIKYRRVHNQVRHQLAGKITFDQLVAESVRLLILLMFLVVGAAFADVDRRFAPEAAIVLVSIPIVLTLHGLWLSWRRREFLSDNTQIPVMDEEPFSGVYVEHDELEPTEEEIDEGNRQGAMIDLDDDDDNGIDDEPD